jgi:hypothetical protein
MKKLLLLSFALITNKIAQTAESPYPSHQNLQDYSLDQLTKMFADGSVSGLANPEKLVQKIHNRIAVGIPDDLKNYLSKFFLDYPTLEDSLLQNLQSNRDWIELPAIKLPKHTPIDAIEFKVNPDLKTTLTLWTRDSVYTCLTGLEQVPTVHRERTPAPDELPRRRFPTNNNKRSRIRFYNRIFIDGKFYENLEGLKSDNPYCQIEQVQESDPRSTIEIDATEIISTICFSDSRKCLALGCTNGMCHLFVRTNCIDLQLIPDKLFLGLLENDEVRLRRNRAREILAQQQNEVRLRRNRVREEDFYHNSILIAAYLALKFITQ